MFRPSFLAAALGAALVLGACSSDEATGHGHTPHEAKLFVGATELTAPYQLDAGQTVRVEIKFYDHDGAELVGLDADHFSAIVFSPNTLATVAAVAGEPFQWDVTAQAAAGSGTVSVNWGHDAAADDLSFGPFNVDVVAAP